MSEHISRKSVDVMFDNIAPDYDRLNHILSMNVDKGWRNKTVRLMQNEPHEQIADFATGTGDLAILMARKLQPKSILGVDFSEQMLAVAEAKIREKGLEPLISLRKENCQATTLSDSSMDAVTCAFGIRNFSDPLQGLKEMHRILKPQSKVFILEFATPKRGVAGSLIKWYYMNVMPFAGKVLAGNRGAYTYLPKSIYDFACGSDFCNLMAEAGFVDAHFKSFTFNMVNLYIGTKE